MKILLFGGGLGNQIFEYAFYLYLKEKFPNEKIYGIYNRFWLNEHNGLEIDKVFNVNLPVSSSRAFFMTTLFFLLKKIRPKTKFCNLNPNDDNLHSIFFFAFKPNKKYYSKQISWLSFKDIFLNEKNAAILKMIKTTESVAVHVRRGDYLNSKHYNIYGNICSYTYYEAAFGIIKTKFKNPVFFVFSDDIDWAKDKFKEEKIYYISWNQRQNSYIDMYLMSNCRANIIANSTFSYWSAYINKNLPIVIYPSRWTTTHCYDIFPDTWIGLI
jgi:hypothetical protein